MNKSHSRGSSGAHPKNQKSKSKHISKTSLGTVKRHPDGFGFFISDDADQPDVYIPRQSMRGVMTNDRIKVSVEQERGGERFRGEVLEIVQRSVTRAMGQFHAGGGSGRGILRDTSFAWGEDLRVSFTPDIQCKEGDLVVVQIEDYPDSARGFSGRVISVIGDAADPLNDSVRMLHAHNIPSEFSKAAIREAEQLAPEVTEKDWAGRKDLRGLPIITIDGKTAKDFDDAVFVENSGSGFHLIVAIADVSHYVRVGSAIDDDAYLRGTSTYFPNFVAPMLPEKLSNELCSLKPRVPRLALVADMHLNFQGELEKSEFYEAVIQSQARVTYGEAQEVLEGNVPPEFKHVADNIRRCADLAKVLMAKRFREGSLDLELPETTIQVDDTGLPVDIMQSERLFSHRLIEELMLMANVAVATFFKDKEIEAIYRIHDEPNPEAMMNFASFLKAFGYKDKIGSGHLQKKISRALEFFKDHPKSHVLNMLALRSLAQAKYSPENIGHFGLGFSNYTHFTSPIRRYPDLIVHRLVKALMYPEKGYTLMTREQLETAGTVLSACEQRSVKAERQINAIKKARFMSAHLGEEFEGVVSSVTRFGLFVLLRQFDIDGLLRMEELGGDRFDYDEEKMRLVGRKSGMAYEIGDLVRIVVAKADIEQGQIDFVMAGGAAQVKGRDQKREAEAGPYQDSRRERRPEQQAQRGPKHGQKHEPRRESKHEPRSAKASRPGQKNESRSGGKKHGSRNGSSKQGRREDSRPGQKSFKPAAPQAAKAAEPMPIRTLVQRLFGKKPIRAEDDSHVEKAGQPISKRRSSEDDSRGVRKSRVSHPRRSR